MTLQLQFRAGSQTALGSEVLPVPSGSLRYASARYLPTQRGSLNVQYNSATGMHEFTPEKAAWLSYVTHEPPTEVIVTEMGSPTANRNRIIQVLEDRLTGGPRKIRIQSGIRITGEEIPVPPVYDGNGLVLWTYIESIAVGSGALRAEGQRVGFDDASLMPKFEMQTYNQRIFRFDTQTNGVRMTGLHMRIDPDRLPTLRASQFGQSAVVGLYNGGFVWSYLGYVGFDPVRKDSPSTPLYRVVGEPQNIIIDRCIIEGDDQMRFIRVLHPNFTHFACVNSWIENAGASNESDSQAIGVGSCRGDHIVWNNEIACAWGEHIIYGGGTTWAEEYLCKDMYVGHNLLTFRDRWHTQGRLHKNMLETKVGVRVTWEGNLIENYYGFDRLGSQLYAIVAKSTDQGSGEPFASAYDMVIRLNKLVRSSGFFVIVGGDYNTNSTFKATHKVDFSHNVQLPWNPDDLNITTNHIIDITGLTIGSEQAGVFEGSDERRRVTDVSIRHNAWFCAHRLPPGENYNAALTLKHSGFQPELRRYDISNNVMAALNPGPGYVIKGNYEQNPSYSTIGLPNSWNVPTKTSVTSQGNLITGITNQSTQLDATMGSSNRGASTLAAAGINASTLALASNSIGKGIAQDGKDPGPDYQLLEVAMRIAATGRDY